MHLKNATQRKLLAILDDWQTHSFEFLLEETGSPSRQALVMQIGFLRKKLRKMDRDILYQEGIGYRLCSLIPHPSHV